MTDSSDRVLADIDARLSECAAGCGQPATGPLYCSEACQTAVMSATVDPLDEPISVESIGYQRSDADDGTVRFDPKK